MSYIVSKFINLNLVNCVRKNDTMLSNVVFYFQNILKDDADIIYSSGGVYNAQFAVSFYIINSTNNVLKYNIGAINYSILLGYGNYNSTSLIIALNNAFVVNGTPILVSINKINGKLTFTYTSNFSFKYFGSTIMKILGFLDTLDYTSSSNILIAPYSLNLIGIKRLSIYSNALSNDSLDSNNLSNSSLIQSIPINISSFYLLSYQNSNLNYGKIQQKFINEIDIKILDENNSFIDFGNIDWTITLQILITKKLKVDFISNKLIDNNLGNSMKKSIVENNINDDLDLLTF